MFSLMIGKECYDER